jgi:hypothetical protein
VSIARILKLTYKMLPETPKPDHLTGSGSTSTKPASCEQPRRQATPQRCKSAGTFPPLAASFFITSL